MKKRWVLLGVLLLLPTIAYAKSAVWVAEKNGHKLYIAGAALLFQKYTLPKEYWQVINRAERVVIIRSDDEKADSTENELKKHILPEGETLEAVLKPDTWKQLKEYMESEQVPEKFWHLDASLLAFALPMFVLQKQGYGLYFIELDLIDRAEQLNKQIVTLRSQPKPLFGSSTQDPNCMIEWILEQRVYINSLNDILATVLFSGDIEKLGMKTVESGDRCIPNNQDLDVLSRNKKWIKEIGAITQDDVPTLAIIWYEFLVGEEGILNLLRKEGYQVSYFEE